MKSKEKLKYQEGEKVLCFQGCLIYEAKILKISTKNKQPLYWVHYTGWKKKWDEWVSQARVLKYSEGNLERQKCLSEQQKVLGKYRRAPPFLLGQEERGKSAENPEQKKEDRKQPTKPIQPQKQTAPVEPPAGAPSLKKRREAALSAADAIRQSVSPVPPAETKDGESKGTVKRKSKESDVDKKKQRKRQILPTVEDEEQWLNLVEVEIAFPPEADGLLYRDWENVNDQQMISSLPARHPISEIFAAWVSECSDQKKVVQRKNLAESLKEYFNSMLSNHLLYEFEKQHHETIVEKYRGKSMCDLYGPVHLLRMFAKIGQMLAYTNLDQHCMKFYVDFIGSFIKYLVDNFDKFGGSEDFFRAPAAYLKACA